MRVRTPPLGREPLSTSGFCSIAAFIVTIVTVMQKNDVLVHLTIYKKEDQATNKKQHKTTKTAPQKKQPNQRTKPNTGNPGKGETVKQSRLSVSEENPGSQISSDNQFRVPRCGVLHSSTFSFARKEKHA